MKITYTGTCCIIKPTKNITCLLYYLSNIVPVFKL